MMYFGQAIGLLAFLLNLKACLNRDERQFKLAILVGCLLWSVHNAILGAHVAAAISLVAAVRTALSFDAQNRRYVGLLIATYLALALGKWNTAHDLLPVAATILGTVALFYCSGVALRIVHCMGAPLWIVHDLHYGSVGGVMSQSLMLGLSLFTICRMLDLRLPRPPARAATPAPVAAA